MLVVESLPPENAHDDTAEIEECHEKHESACSWQSYAHCMHIACRPIKCLQLCPEGFCPRVRRVAYCHVPC